jgi:Ca-activated chloride channel family protein
MRTPIAIGAVLGLIAVAAVALHAVAADAGGCSVGLRLVVAAAPDIAPAVHDAATHWEQTNPKVNGQCVRVQVDATPPAELANALAVRAGSTISVAAQPVATPAEADVPAVWIPDSSSWILRVQAISRDIFDPDIQSVALSPVMLAMPEAVARTLPGGGARRLTTAEVAGLIGRMQSPDQNVKFGVVEPRRDAAGLAGITMVYELIAVSRAQLPNVVGAYRQLSVAPDQASIVRSLAASTTIAPLSEQSVLAFDAASPSMPLSAVPVEAPAVLDYPYATITGRPHGLAKAAQMFRAALLGTAYREPFVRAGFRFPDGSAGAGFPVGHGVTADPAVGRPLTNMQRVRDVFSIWGATVNPSRVLALVDVTQSMSLPMTTSKGQSVPRINVLRQTVTAGLGLFVSNSEAGVWAFAAGIGPDGKDYKEVLPIAPLSAGQRDALSTVFDAAQPVPTNTCGLYDTILAAYREVRDSYRPDSGNTVVVFTDSTNSKPGMNLDQMLRELEKLTDITRPVVIIVLGLGPDVDVAELSKIAGATGGRAFQVTSPDDIGQIAIQALLGV